MSENLSEVFSRTWWIIVVSFLSGLALNILANFLTEIIKKKQSKYSESLRSKKSQRIEEQKKLAAELSTNHSRLLLYLTSLVVKLMLFLFLVALGLSVSAAGGYSFGAGYTVYALILFVFTFLLIAATVPFLKSFIFNVPTLVLLNNRFQKTEQTPTNKKPNQN